MWEELLILAVAVVLAFIPVMAVTILAVYLATVLGLKGIVWWAFVIVFFMITLSIMNINSRLKE